MKLAVILFLATATASCTTAQIAAMDGMAGMGVMTNVTDGFDGAQRLRVSPAFVAKTQGTGGIAWTAGFTVGAQWLDTTPGTVDMLLQIENGITGIRALGINANGVITNYPTAGLTSIDINSDERYVDPVSTAYVPVPIDDFLKLMQTDDIKLRMYTLDGYLDADFGALRGRAGALTARYYIQNKFVPALPAQ